MLNLYSAAKTNLAFIQSRRTLVFCKGAYVYAGRFFRHRMSNTSSYVYHTIRLSYRIVYISYNIISSIISYVIYIRHRTSIVRNRTSTPDDSFVIVRLIRHRTSIIRYVYHIVWSIYHVISYRLSYRTSSIYVIVRLSYVIVRLRRTILSSSYV